MQEAYPCVVPLLAALFAALLLAAPAGAAQVVVRLEPGASSADAARLAASVGGRVADSVPQLRAYLLDVPAARRQAVPSLGESPLVRSVEPAASDRLAGEPAQPAPPYRGPDWQLTAIRAPAAWATTRGGAGAVIAILDTGVDASRPELAGRLVPGWDVADEDGDPADTNGHGTFVAGLAASDSPWETGVCPGCAIMPVKIVPDGSTEATKLDSAEGMVWAVDHGARVLNLSIGGPGRSPVQDDAVAYALAHGAVVVASAGNEDTTVPQYPAALDGVLAVGGTDDRDRRWSASSYGPWVDLGAPADRLLSLALAGGYERRSGTSYAAPLVAGAAGLLLTAFPDRSGADVERALRAGTDPLALAQRAFDRGRLDVPRALAAAAAPGAATLTIVRLALSPAAFLRRYPEARAGLDFAVGALVVDGGGAAVADGRVSCSGRAAGRALAVRRTGFVRGAAVCVLGVPGGAGDRWVEGTIRVERGGSAVEQPFRVKARKPLRQRRAA
jgi:subtilisin family serine protease